MESELNHASFGCFLLKNPSTSKKQKTPAYFFDEARPIIEVCIYNTSLKNRLSEYARKYLSECQLADDELAKKNIKNLRQGKT